MSISASLSRISSNSISKIFHLGVGTLDIFKFNLELFKKELNVERKDRTLDLFVYYNCLSHDINLLQTIPRSMFHKMFHVVSMELTREHCLDFVRKITNDLASLNYELTRLELRIILLSYYKAGLLFSTETLVGKLDDLNLSKENMIEFLKTILMRYTALGFESGIQVLFQHASEKVLLESMMNTFIDCALQLKSMVLLGKFVDHCVSNSIIFETDKFIAILDILTLKYPIPPESALMKTFADSDSEFTNFEQVTCEVVNSQSRLNLESKKIDLRNLEGKNAVTSLEKPCEDGIVDKSLIQSLIPIFVSRGYRNPTSFKQLLTLTYIFQLDEGMLLWIHGRRKKYVSNLGIKSQLSYVFAPLETVFIYLAFLFSKNRQDIAGEVFYQYLSSLPLPIRRGARITCFRHSPIRVQIHDWFIRLCIESHAYDALDRHLRLMNDMGMKIDVSTAKFLLEPRARIRSCSATE